MNDTEKARTQQDAQRTVASRRTSASSRAEQSILRHLGIELYKERRRSETAAKEAETEQATDEPPTH